MVSNQYTPTPCRYPTTTPLKTEVGGEKRRKEHQALITGLSKGDEVVTSGGIVGQIKKVEDDFVKIQVANNIELRVQKSAVGATLPKGTLKSLDES